VQNSYFTWFFSQIVIAVLLKNNKSLYNDPKNGSFRECTKKSTLSINLRISQ